MNERVVVARLFSSWAEKGASGLAMGGRKYSTLTSGSMFAVALDDVAMDGVALVRVCMRAHARGALADYWLWPIIPT